MTVASEPARIAGGRVSARVLAGLSAAGHGCVHSRFSSGFNVALGGELIFFGRASAPLSCVGAALPDEMLTGALAQVRPADRVIARGTRLRIYDRSGVLDLDLARLEPVDLRVAGLVGCGIDGGRRAELERRILALGLRERIGLPVDERLLWCARVLAARDAGERDLAGCIAFLLGRGLGLTPSGDDVLVGFGWACWLRRRERAFMRSLARARLEQTTDVSRAYLRALLDGCAHEDYLDLARALRDGATKRLPALLARIQRMGHTSGSDGLLGFALGCGFEPERLLSAASDSPPPARGRAQNGSWVSARARLDDCKFVFRGKNDIVRSTSCC